LKTITFNATKGGTGKSTLSIIALNALTGAGYKCLAIDTDMINHSLSFYFNSGIPFEQINLRRFKRFKLANDRLVTKDIFIHLRGWKVPSFH
jgi:cellulose biosynthesis protein BcsQ